MNFTAINICSKNQRSNQKPPEQLIDLQHGAVSCLGSFLHASHQALLQTTGQIGDLRIDAVHLRQGFITLLDQLNHLGSRSLVTLQTLQRLGQLRQYLGRQLDLQSAPPGADINAGKLLRRLIDKGTQTLLLPQRADATEQVTGRALRCIGVSHIGFLHPGSLRQGFQIQRAGHRHHRHQQLAFLTGGQQRLEHLSRLKVELFRRFQAIGSRLGVVVITVHLVRSLGFFQQIDGRRHVRM